MEGQKNFPMLAQNNYDFPSLVFRHSTGFACGRSCNQRRRQCRCGRQNSFHRGHERLCQSGLVSVSGTIVCRFRHSWCGNPGNHSLWPHACGDRKLPGLARRHGTPPPQDCRRSPWQPGQSRKSATVKYAPIPVRNRDMAGLIKPGRCDLWREHSLLPPLPWQFLIRRAWFP